MSLVNEEVLLERLAQGDELAFKALYDFYAPGIFRVASRYLQSDILAEDVLQEIFLSVWVRQAGFPEVKSFQAYLLTMTRNLCLKLLKNDAENARIRREFLFRMELDTTESERDYHQMLQQAIESLPPQQQLIFKMAKLQRMSHEAIARELQLSASTVNNHVTAALRSVRAYLRQAVAAWILLAASFWAN